MNVPKPQDEKFWPLVECARFAVATASPLHYWINRIFPISEDQYAGGDPGWEISNVDLSTGERLRDESGSAIYRAWIDSDISGLVPCEGFYDEATVKLHVRMALENFAKFHPDRKAEVGKILKEYGL